MNNKVAKDDLVLFEIFARFMWREVDVIEEHDLPDIEIDAENGAEFMIDFDADITYRHDPESPNNVLLMHELETVAQRHGLKISLDFPNNDLVYDIEPNLVDIEVARDTDGRWRIQPNFSLR